MISYVFLLSVGSLSVDVLRRFAAASLSLTASDSFVTLTSAGVASTAADSTLSIDKAEFFFKKFVRPGCIFCGH